MFRVLAAVAAFAVGATAVWAQNVAGVTVRKETMKTLGSAWKGPADMAKGVVTPGSTAPAFSVDSVTDFAAQQNGQLARQITGSFTVPCYIEPTCSP